VVFFGAPFVAGVVFRIRRDRDVELAGRARRAMEEGERRASEAVTEERARIARELHDVVAHAISVIVVQARAGRRVLKVDLDAALASFDAIEHTGEQALMEMRRLVTLVRDAADRPGPDLDPQAGLDRLPALAEEFTRSGLPVDLRCEGAPTEVPPGVDLSAYRIVQEALTNTLKHAGRARARVVVRHRHDALEVEVVDDGDGSGRGGGSGYGLVGIRERVDVYGGQLDVGAEPGGGFAVRARLPLQGAT
jgi:signal transduction histidine kinase